MPALRLPQFVLRPHRGRWPLCLVFCLVPGCKSQSCFSLSSFLRRATDTIKGESPLQDQHQVSLGSHPPTGSRGLSMLPRAWRLGGVGWGVCACVSVGGSWAHHSDPLPTGFAPCPLPPAQSQPCPPSMQPNCPLEPSPSGLMRRVAGQYQPESQTPLHTVHPRQGWGGWVPPSTPHAPVGP